MYRGYIEVIPPLAAATGLKSTTMLNKKQVLERVGVSPTSPYRHKVLEQLREYENPYNSHARYRDDEVASLLNHFKEVER